MSARINEELAPTYEALKADRDAQQKRADALAVENAALMSNLMFWDADNPESPYDSPEEIANDCSLDYNDEFDVQVAARLPNRTYRVCEAWDCDCKLEIVEGAEIETPATDAALAAIEARGVEKFAEATISIGEQEKEESIIYAGKQAMLFAEQLREGK
ncbi:hypothetical protein [Serratia proteamaculans]|uniref:hypothetical protein n=1 Tax=Serratia proteamaculans TaxID=28151 RepID=UPI002178CB2E|nr:hypothetical protein [Serratia proteamaculans]CAI1179173.1 Uncharacterised protein [Serratia proteamaculans]